MNGARTQLSADNEAKTFVAPLLGRARTVTFRVSGAEFSILARAWQSSGARSLSAFARDASLERAQSLKDPSVSLSGGLTTLTRALTQLDATLQEASSKIRRILDPSAAGGDRTETGD